MSAVRIDEQHSTVALPAGIGLDPGEIAIAPERERKAIDAYLERVTAAWEQAGPSSNEYRVVRQDGQVAWLSSHAKTLADAAGRVLGAGASSLISGLVMVSTFGSLAGVTMSEPRLFFAMGRDRNFFAATGRVHPRYQTPHVAIPTTHGTGSEVTPFAVLIDKARGRKVTLADYSLTPDVAIVDPQFVMSMPKVRSRWAMLGKCSRISAAGLWLMSR